MRLLSVSLVFVAALFTITACNSKSSSSSDQTNATATTGAEATSADNTASSATAAPAGEVPQYPGAATQASGSSSNMGQSATGSVMSTDDAFDKVYQWYQQHMPAGSEKSHITSPMQSAVFMIGDPGKGQTSVTITVTGGKTMITTAKVKM
jgi:hypothetical protein